jgi:putative ABC transport system permease protein
MALLLSKDYLKLLAISILIAGPFSFYINRLWLDTLVVRAPFNFGTVLLGASLLLALGILFIGPQTLKIAGTNPVDTLKNE